MNGWEIDKQRRQEIASVLKHFVWAMPLPFLMSLKVGYDFYILGPAYYLALIQHRNRRPAAFLFAFIGVLMLNTKVLRLQYGLLIALFTAQEIYLSRKKPLLVFWKRCLVYETGLGLVTAGLGMVGVLEQYQILTILLEAIFLLAAACLYYQVMEQKGRSNETFIVGVSLTFGTMLAAFHWVNVGGILPAEVLLLVLSMAGGYRFGLAKGLAFSLPAGLFMRITLTAGEGLLIVSTLLVILSGIFRETGRKAAVLSCFSGGCLWILLFMGGQSVMTGLFTVGISSFLFGTIPTALLKKPHHEKERKSVPPTERYLERRFNRGAEAFQRMAELITVPSQKTQITSQDLVYLKEDIAVGLCQECEKQPLCWGKRYTKTHETVVRVMEASRSKGKVERSDVPLDFLQTCQQATDFVRAVNRHYELYRLNQSWENRMARHAKLLQGYCHTMADFLSDTQEHFVSGIAEEEAASKKLTQLFNAQGIRARRLSVVVDNHEEKIYVSFEVVNPLGYQEKQRCMHILTDFFGRSMRPQIGMAEGRVVAGGLRYEFIDADPYEVEIGVISRSREEINGDSFTAKQLDESRFVLALGDGMGSGPAAKEQSEKALILLEQILLSGMNEEEAAGLLNTSLLLSNQEEAFTTLDLALLNLHNGKLKLIKAGGSTTFLRSRNAVYVYHSHSLPVGLLEEAVPETFSHDMQPGDLLVMLSDGVLDVMPDARRAEKELRRLILNQPEDISAQEIADLMAEVTGTADNLRDDQTILAARLYEA